MVPPGVVPSYAGRRIATIIVSGILALGLGIGGLLLPVPYVELTPNPPCDTLATLDQCTPGASSTPIIEISGHRSYPITGHLFLTDVAIVGAPGHPISLGTALKGWLDSSIAVLPRDVIYPPSQSATQTAQQNAKEMVDSQRAAKDVAVCTLQLVPPCVAISGFAAHSPARAAGLSIGDRITSVDGSPVTTADELTALIAQHAVGDTVTIGYRHGGGARTARIQLVAGTGRTPRIGVVVHPVVGRLPFTIRIQLPDVGGPSAGLMFALGIIEKLTSTSLTGGRSIAGTGTISADGRVGPIGGIEQKVIGASRAGATVFLTPAENCADAKTARPDGLRLVKVDTLHDALAALAALRGEPGTIHDC